MGVGIIVLLFFAETYSSLALLYSNLILSVKEFNHPIESRPRCGGRVVTVGGWCVHVGVLSSLIVFCGIFLEFLKLGNHTHQWDTAV